MKYRDFLAILLARDFVEVRCRGTHHQYRAEIDGEIRLVTVDYAQPGEDISPRNLASMIRQSGLPKKTFR